MSPPERPTERERDRGACPHSPTNQAMPTCATKAASSSSRRLAQGATASRSGRPFSSRATTGMDRSRHLVEYEKRELYWIKSSEGGQPGGGVFLSG